MAELKGYELSRTFFDWSYENYDINTPTHVALYFFCIDLNNRCGWKEKFGLPVKDAMEAIGVKNYKTFKTAFDDLANWGFLKVHKKSQNQYTANVIALVKNTKATTKALAKASVLQSKKHVAGTAHIDKLENLEPKNERGAPAYQNYDLEYYKSIGYDWNLSEKKYAALDLFLKYRRTHPKHGPVDSPHIVESILREITTNRISDETFDKMVNYTLSKGAKNMIWEVGTVTPVAEVRPRKFLNTVS